MSSPPESFFSTFKRPPSFPLMPTAFTPSFCTICTRLLLTRFKTISAISMVGSSVTLRPFTKWGSIPTFPTQRLISFPLLVRKIAPEAVFCFWANYFKNASIFNALPKHFHRLRLIVASKKSVLQALFAFCLQCLDRGLP